MLDDGSSGDLMPNDNVYSLRVFLSSANLLGDYRFKFQARDYSELLSNEIIHTITVTE